MNQQKRESRYEQQGTRAILDGGYSPLAAKCTQRADFDLLEQCKTHIVLLSLMVCVGSCQLQI